MLFVVQGGMLCLADVLFQETAQRHAGAQTTSQEVEPGGLSLQIEHVDRRDLLKALVESQVGSHGAQPLQQLIACEVKFRAVEDGLEDHVDDLVDQLPVTEAGPFIVKPQTDGQFPELLPVSLQASGE
jgi:hypothetical protein